MYRFFTLLLFLGLLFTTNLCDGSMIPQFKGPKLTDADRIALLQSARNLLETGETQVLVEKSEPVDCVLLLSLSKPKSTAILTEGASESLQHCVRMAAEMMRDRTTPKDRMEGRLKIDLALSVSPEHSINNNRYALDSSLEGIEFSESRFFLLPEELLSRDLITAEGILQIPSLRDYLQEGARLGNNNAIKNDLSNYFVVKFDSFMETMDDGMVRLHRGNVNLPSISAENLLQASWNGGEYLLRHQHADGMFDYNYDPRTNQTDSDYNLLRHAGTCYALLELYNKTGDARFLQAARIGIEALLRFTNAPMEEHLDSDFEAIVSGGEAKLGGAALALLALVEYQLATHDSSWLHCARRLAGFLLFQQKKTGEFVSKYYYRGTENEVFESLYYPGESILALIRLYQIDPDPTWLHAAMKGADWLILTRDANKKTADLPHDHWLLIALNELEQITGKRTYAAHSFRIAQAILTQQRVTSQNQDWIGSFYDPPRSTPTAIRAEGLIAVWKLAVRNGAPRAVYLEALRKMALFQLRCQFTVQNVIYLPRPDLALGGFRRSLTDWDVRIDYVQHNLSALLGLYSILADPQN